MLSLATDNFSSRSLTVHKATPRPRRRCRRLTTTTERRNPISGITYMMPVMGGVCRGNALFWLRAYADSTKGLIWVAIRSTVSSSNGAAVSMMKVVTPMRFHWIINSVIRSGVVK